MAAVLPSSVDVSLAMTMDPVALADWLVILPPAWCIACGAVLLMLRSNVQLQARLGFGMLFVLVILDAALLWHVIEQGRPVTMVMGRWLPPFGIAFTVDLTGALFALTSGIAAVAAALYAATDIEKSQMRYGFYPMLLMLMAGVTGAFLTGDIFNLYVWFEVLLISSFGLLALGGQRGQIDGAVKYGFLNLVATTLFLITTALLYGMVGTLNMADIARKASGLAGSAPLVTVTALFILAFAMKAAAFPVNGWLPASYHTPSVTVSALFAGLLTKVGVYALLRVSVMLFPVQRQEIDLAIAVIGVLTMIVGGLGAIAQTDLRRMLGYLVISGIGAMLGGLALGPSAVAGVLVYALHSMVVMTALYMAVGLAARVGGFSLGTAGSIYQRSPLLAALSLALFFSVSGLPPFSGFWPKVMLVKAAIDAGSWPITLALLLTGFLTMIATGRAFLLAYWRPAVAATVEATRPLPRSAMAGVLLLTAISMGIGLFPQPLIRLADEAAAGLNTPDAYIDSVFPASPGGGSTP